MHAAALAASKRQKHDIRVHANFTRNVNSATSHDLMCSTVLYTWQSYVFMITCTLLDTIENPTRCDCTMQPCSRERIAVNDLIRVAVEDELELLLVSLMVQVCFMI